MPCSRAPPWMRTGGRPSWVSMHAPISRSGWATRSIGRRIRDASPTSSESKDWPASRPMKSRIAVPALPMSSTVAGAHRPAQPDAFDPHFAGRGPLDTGAEARHAPQRRQAVLALEETRDARRARRRWRRASAPGGRSTCRRAPAAVRRRPGAGSTMKSLISPAPRAVRGSPADTSRGSGTAMPGPSVPRARSTAARPPRGPRGR